jgi:hypothetical protein
VCGARASYQPQHGLLPGLRHPVKQVRYIYAQTIGHNSPIRPVPKVCAVVNNSMVSFSESRGAM